MLQSRPAFEVMLSEQDARGEQAGEQLKLSECSRYKRASPDGERVRHVLGDMERQDSGRLR